MIVADSDIHVASTHKRLKPKSHIEPTVRKHEVRYSPREPITGIVDCSIYSRVLYYFEGHVHHS